MKRKLIFVLLLMGMGVILYAQTINVTGRVTSVYGEDLIGVNVIEKGTVNGTITNVDGTYSIAADSSAVLVFSFVGYKTTEVEVNGQQVIDVEMEEGAYSLEELVITALGISQEKKTIGYSTQEIDAAPLSKNNAQNIGNLLTGTVAGLAVNNPTGMFQSPSFSLRGKSPLIVIDDIPVSTDLFDINANDIAEITVLKGTTASALYGSRGRNGAILIETKKAQQSGFHVEVSNSTMATAGFTVFPETQTEYGNGSLGKYEFWDGKDGGISDGDMIWGPKFSDNLEIPQWNSPIYDNVTGDTIPWWGDVSGTKYDDKSRYSRVPIPWEYHNNLKDFLRTGIVSTSNFAISYKDEKFNYRFSGSYTGHRGQVPNTSLNQGGLSFTSSYKLSNALTLDGKFSYNKVHSPNYPRYGYGPRNHIYTILIWMGDDVNGKDLAAHHYIPGQEGYRQANFNYAWYNNVYFAAYELNQIHDTDVLNGQLKLAWELAKNLYLQGRTSAVRKGRFEDRASPKSYLNYGDPREGDYKTWNSDWLTMDNDVLLTYRNQVSSNFGFAMNAGAASYYHKYAQYYNATDGIIVPWVYSLNNTRGNVKASTYEMERAVRSIYATLDLDLMDAFYLTVAARNDWSSTLPASNNSYFYPSASLSTMVSNLIELPSYFDYLKLYGSWAEVSSDLSPYSISSYYNNAGSFAGNTMLTYPGGIINPDIKPEKSTSFELGTSVSFLQNRLSMDVTYFNILDENQIIDLPITISSGFNNRKVNGNEYTTNGLEIVLNMNPVKQANFRWDAAVNWDRRVTKLTDIYGEEDKYGNYSLNERTDNYYATGWMRTPDGELIVSESTGLPIRDPYPQMHGHLEPDFRFGFQNRLKYRKIGIDIDFDGVYGGLMRSLTVEKMWWGGKHPNSTEYRDAEYAAGEPVYVPDAVNVVSGELVRDVDGNIISDDRVFQENTTKVNWQTWAQNYPYRATVTQMEDEQFANVFDRSFLKLRRLSVSYDASELISIRGLKGLELTAYGYNLFILKKAIIIDPDFGNDNSLQDPSARYLGGSIRLTF